jgi:putative transposase
MSGQEGGYGVEAEHVTRYRLRRSDKVVINEVAYVPVSADNDGHVLKRVDGSDIEEAFTHVEIKALFGDGAARLERGAFSAPTAEAARFRGYRLTDLGPERKRMVLFRKHLCDRFMQLKEEDPSISLSDAGMENALRKLESELDIANREAGAGGRAGRHIGAQQKVPDASTLRRWLKRYKNSGYNPVALADKHPSGGRKTSRSSDEDALYMKYARAYASRNKPTKQMCYAALGREIENLNKERARSGEPQLRLQDRRTFERLIDSLDDYFVCSGREGADAASKKFAIVNRGLDVERPFQRLEIDEHRVDLIVFLKESGVLNCMDPEQVAALKERERAWLTVALDARTRMVAAMLLTREAPSAQTALATLEMAVKDTSELESVLGAATSFAHGTPETVAVDAGSSFVSDQFEAAVTDMGARIVRPPDKKPQMRGRVERFFGTVRDKAIRHFQGQTFDNVVNKGDYDSEGHATLNFDELNRVLLKTLLNIYHAEGHSGLGGQSPADCWRELNEYYQVDPPPDVDCRRHIFGLEEERRVGARGVLFSGIYYQSDELQKIRQRNYSSSVRIRVDRFDLSVISVFQGQGWITVPARFDGLEGVTYWEWRDAVRDFRERYGDKEKATEGQMQETLAEIRSLAERAGERAGLSAPTLSQEDYDRDQKHLYRNLEIERERENSTADSDGVGLDDGLGLEGQSADQASDGRTAPVEKSSSETPGAAKQNQLPKRPQSPKKKKKKISRSEDKVAPDPASYAEDENDEFGDINDWTSE